jgi:membrane-bound serine protease (ClpP class)
LTLNLAFVLLICGIFAIYSELIQPGRIVPGLSGAALVLVGGHALLRNSPASLGLELLAGAAALFTLEVFFDTYLLAGVLGTVAAACGFGKLFPGRPGISPMLAIPLCLIFGVITVFLSTGAKRARRNKRNFSSAVT